MTRSFIDRLSFQIVIVFATLLPSSCGAPENTELRVLTSVRFGMLPYADHTYAAIGIEKGWFAEAGIDLQEQVIQVEQIVPYLQNGTLDVISTPPGILMSAHDNAPGLVSFVFGDLFQGYALMGDSTLQSYSELTASGMNPDEALRAAVQQVRGKVFAYPTEAAIQPFIELLLEQGGLARADFTALVQDDPLTVNAMRSGQAQFQTGGVPSRITLTKEGFKPLVTSVDLARRATPSDTSAALASLLQNGWATTREYYDAHRETILRLAGVNYRIMQFIADYPDSALAIHMPYLSRVTGEEYGVDDGRVIYRDLDPFYTFEAQREWFEDSTSMFYYRNINGSILHSFITGGVVKNQVVLDSIIFADDVYVTLDSLRAEADSLIASGRAQTNQSSRVTELLEKAEADMRAFRFVDAVEAARRATGSQGSM